MPFSFRLRRPKPPVTAVPVPPLRRSWTARLAAPPSSVWRGLCNAFSALDRAFAQLAVPFGVRIRRPLLRYGVLLGSFAVIYVLGTLPLEGVSLIALGFGYIGVLAVGRAWVVNEKQRAAIVKKLVDADPDQLPDLRGAALVSALQLFILFPLLFQQLHWHYGIFRVEGPTTFTDWLWFALDKTYLKALPDWSMLYGVHISRIDFAEPWGRHLVFLSRLTFDYILIQGVFRLLAIRVTIAEAVAAVRADPEMAVRLGRRAIAPLVAKLHDPDRAVRGAAANALTQLGDHDALRKLSEAQT
jgi:hypothetical protein